MTSGSSSMSGIGDWSHRPIRSRPGGRPAQPRNVSPGGSGGAHAGSPSTGPAIASSIAAASRTVLASGPLVPSPVTSPP